MLRKFLLFSISIQKVFRDHSGLFALSYAFSSTLCSGAIEPFKQGFYQFEIIKKWKEATLLLIVLILYQPDWQRYR